MTPESLAAFVIAVSFAAGLNVYATVLTLGLLARLHWVALPSGLDAVGHTWVLAAAAALFAVEFFADKIPAFDLVWNAAHTFVRLPVAALLAYGATTHLPPEMHLLATVLGTAIATAAHGSKIVARAAVTPSPEPISNIALSSAEDVAAVGLTWTATHHPYVGAGVASGLMVACVFAGWLGFRFIQRGWQRLRGSRSLEARR
ncbi:protein of unknown function [Granulicella rosea]|uniref:DUF4126 domain-containing protein n=1 Tax=Granulicella rosea TaxID=474952 RepID=A0A239L2Z6_9BACT|nr:DUF4126 domain-containing protein [Granulicella rosea]SNT23914.1 protein of unknown function [Granulicella rosea]